MQGIDPLLLLGFAFGDEDPNTSRSVDGEGVALARVTVGVDGGSREIDVTLWFGGVVGGVVQEDLSLQDAETLLPVLDDATLLCEVASLVGVGDGRRSDISEGELEGVVDFGGAHVLRCGKVVLDPLVVVVFQNSSVLNGGLVGVDP